MRSLRSIAVAGVLCCLLGCRTGPDLRFYSSPWENAKDARDRLGDRKNVFVACIYEDHWEDEGPRRLVPHHFKATVVRSFKGRWRFSERVAFVHFVDAPAPAVINSYAGMLAFVATNEHTEREIGLDTGDFVICDANLERALEITYPRSSR